MINQESNNFDDDDRDELVPNEIPPATQPDLFRDIPRQADYEAPPLNPYYCLLYTSDAADE